MMIRELPLCITLVDPPRGVTFCLQRGKAELVPPSADSGKQITFDLTVNVDMSLQDKPPSFRGPFVQGPLAARFIYINSGTYARQTNTVWSRRAKVQLGGITWELIEQALAAPGTVLQAQLMGTGRDGGPVCATVPLLDGGWQVCWIGAATEAAAKAAKAPPAKKRATKARK
jgi:hypothetical protein